MTEKEINIYNKAVKKCNNTVYIPDVTEYFFKTMFGRVKYHQRLSHDISLTAWKKELTKLFKHLKKFISVNVDSTDKQHYNKLMEYCDLAFEVINISRGKDEVNISILTLLFKINFLLMGDLPYNEKIRNSRNLWKLDRFRKITYCQTLEQKFELIMDKYDLRKEPSGSDFKKSFQYKLISKLHEFNQDYCKFIEWFRENHRQKYDELFW